MTPSLQFLPLQPKGSPATTASFFSLASPDSDILTISSMAMEEEESVVDTTEI